MSLMKTHPTDGTGAPITSYLRAELENLAIINLGPFTQKQIFAELARRDEIERRPRDERHA